MTEPYDECRLPNLDARVRNGKVIESLTSPCETKKVKRAQEINQLTTDWERLGAEDPFWAVCVDPAKKGGRWNYDEFLASGRDEIAAIMPHVDRFGLAGKSGTQALDFGCGAGRLSTALAAYFDRVVGMDISRSILAEAASRDESGGRCVYLHNEHPDLRACGDRSFDLVYSSLTLQHMSRGLALAYIREFFRVVKADGIVVFSVPVASRWTLKAAVFKVAPARVVGWIQTRLLRYPAPMRMNTIPRRTIEAVAKQYGCRILATSEPVHQPRDWNVVQFVIKPTSGSDAYREFPPPRLAAPTHAP